jgi:hypothetical protein
MSGNDFDVMEYYSGSLMSSERMEIGDSLVCTIRDVRLGEFPKDDGSSESKAILGFEETDEELVLNKTNASTIAGRYSSKAKNWIGKKIGVRCEECDFKGRRVKCLRVFLGKQKETLQEAARKAAAEEDIPF